jgi:hypothetical protein
MAFIDAVKKEIRVAVYGQSIKFRLIKYSIIIPLAVGLYLWRGVAALAWVFGPLAILALATHFFFRYKTKAWSEDWWLVKNMKDKF